MASDNTLKTMLGVWLFAAWLPIVQGTWLGNAAAVLPSTSPSTTHQFTLRHGVQHLSGVKIYDVNPARLAAASLLEGQDGEEDSVGPFTVRSSTTKIERMKQRSISDIQDLMSEARYFGRPAIMAESAWTLDDVLAPDARHRETVLGFAQMAANAYGIDEDSEDWKDPPPPWNHSSSFGWKGDSLRGHVFVNKDNSTIVVAIKGTSPAVWDGQGTTTNDKVNDNLFFSCCCGQGGSYLWLPVCTCTTSAYTCNQTCLVKELKRSDRYYNQVIELYGNVTEIYPDANVWLTGHSLGGATASMLGLTFGLPVITFEAVPEALPAARLGLPVPPSNKIGTQQSRQYTGGYHYGHNADPVFMGTCNGPAFCTIGGYAMQSQCHTGNKCTWDTMGDRKWRQSLTTHGIKQCVKDVYQYYDYLPECEHDTECQDCAIWKFYESNHTDTTTSKEAPPSTTRTRTRTETCRNPGWWGCNDPTSTGLPPVVTSTTTIITETCKSYGWFGRCLDATPTTETITSTIPITITPTTTPTTTASTTATTTATTTCETPGWWGCNDQDIATLSSTISTSSPVSSICETPGRFWGCKDQTRAALTHEITAAPHLGL